MVSEAIQKTVYGYLQDEANVVFLVFSRDGQVVEANKYTEQLLGAGLVGRSFHEVFVDFDGSLRFDDLISDSQRLQALDVTPRTGMPKTFYFRFFDLGTEILAMGRSKRRGRGETRSQVLSLNQNLANLNRQLQQSIAELARLNEQKTQFVGMAAHDLRSPLGTITMAAQCLRMQAEDVLENESLDFLSRIESVSESARHLVEAFLDLSVVESGRLTIERKPTDIRAVVDKARPLLEIPPGKKQVWITVRHGLGPESVMADGPRLEQVVVNFLSNAVQHTYPNSNVRDFHMPGRDRSQGVGHRSGPRVYLGRRFPDSSSRSSEGPQRKLRARRVRDWA